MPSALHCYFAFSAFSAAAALLYSAVYFDPSLCSSGVQPSALFGPTISKETHLSIPQQPSSPVLVDTKDEKAISQEASAASKSEGNVSNQCIKQKHFENEGTEQQKDGSSKTRNASPYSTVETNINNLLHYVARDAKQSPAVKLVHALVAEKVLTFRTTPAEHWLYLQALLGFLHNQIPVVVVLMNSVYVTLFVLGRQTTKFFFGSLRVIESQHMYDRLLNFLLFKVVFIGAILEPKWEELLIWTTWFAVLGFLRVFSMLCRDRFEYRMFSPTVPLKAHLRILTLLVVILVSDVFWFVVCIGTFRSMLLFLTFECFTLLLDTTQTLVKYVVHLRDMTREGVWEYRGLVLYYTEFLTDTTILMATLGHYLHIMILHGVSFTLIDAVLFLNMRSVLNNLRKKINAYRAYRAVLANMQTRYVDATDEDITSFNDDCAICRESMCSAKKLPCGHIFHLTCLRSWLEHHGSCPICRRSLVEPSARRTTPITESGSGIVNGDAEMENNHHQNLPSHLQHSNHNMHRNFSNIIGDDLNNSEGRGLEARHLHMESSEVETDAGAGVGNGPDGGMLDMERTVNGEARDEGGVSRERRFFFSTFSSSTGIGWLSKRLGFGFRFPRISVEVVSRRSANSNHVSIRLQQTDDDAADDGLDGSSSGHDHILHSTHVRNHRPHGRRSSLDATKHHALTPAQYPRSASLHCHRRIRGGLSAMTTRFDGDELRKGEGGGDNLREEER